MKIKIFTKKEKKQKKRDVSVYREYFELISEVLIYVFFVMTFLLQSFVIPTGSMETNLLIGDHLLVDKVAYSRSTGIIDKFLFPQIKIKRGMIVTFKAPPELKKEKEYVKRVIALPGETVKIVDKKVYINGKPVEEKYKRHIDSGNIYSLKNTVDLERAARDNFPLNDPYDLPPKFDGKFRSSVVKTEYGKAFLVPDGYYFCLGDNRDKSFDSRLWGPVPEEFIIGKPWRIYWSYDSTSEEYLTPSLWYKIKDLIVTIINFIPKTRWGRTIKKIE